nr:copia protein [Tanacetum cinerariifolium]
MDVKSAFLNGFINEEVYVAQPSGFIDFAKPNYVYRLKKALYGLRYPKGSGIETIVYADSDHMGDYVDRKSTSGVFTFMGCFLTSCFSKKQTALAISTTKAEYVSAEKACQQALWMKQAFINYGVRLEDILITCDNKGAINLSKNPVQHSRIKHIEICHHFIHDNVQKGNISIEKVSSEDNIADILTKPLKREPFNYLRLETDPTDGPLSDFEHVQYFQAHTRTEIRQVRDTLIQHMESLRESILERAKHKRAKDRRLNDRMMQSKERKDNSSNALDDDLVVTKSNETELERHVLSSKSRNDTHIEDVDINSVNHKQPMAEVQLSVEHNILANEQQHSEQFESVYDTYLLKKAYKDLSDSIKKTSVQTKDHADSLIVQLNCKSIENADLKAQFSSQVDVNNVFSKLVTPHYLPKVSESASAKPHHVNAHSSSRNSKKELYGSNDMAHNYYLEEAKKKTQDKNRNLKPREMPSERFILKLEIMSRTLLKLNLPDHRSILADSQRRSVKVKELQEKCIIKAFQVIKSRKLRLDDEKHVTHFKVFYCDKGKVAKLYCETNKRKPKTMGTPSAWLLYPHEADIETGCFDGLFGYIGKANK